MKLYHCFVFLLLLQFFSCDLKHEEYLYKDAQSVRTKLNDIGFINHKEGKNHYKLEVLDTMASEEIKSFLWPLHDKEDKALIFFIKLAAWTHQDSLSRQTLFTYYLDTYEDYGEDFKLLCVLYKNKSQPRYFEALRFYTDHLDADQSIKLLSGIGYLIFSDTGTGPSSHFRTSEEKLEIVPKDIIKILAENVRKGFTTGQKRSIARSLERYLEESKYSS